MRGARGEFTIILSPQVIAEVLELPLKAPARYAVTDEKVSTFLAALVPSCLSVDLVPHVFDHPIDPDDSGYVDLAIAAGASAIVSRDKHLLGLVDTRKPWSADFRTAYPNLKVVTVEILLDLLRRQVPAGQ